MAAIKDEALAALARSLCGALCVTAIVQSYIAAFAYPSDPVQLRRAESASPALNNQIGDSNYHAWSWR